MQVIEYFNFENLLLTQDKSNYIKGNVTGSKTIINNNFLGGNFFERILNGICWIKSFLPKSSLASNVRVRVRVRLGLG
jgi:hypothetical protein